MAFLGAFESGFHPKLGGFALGPPPFWAMKRALKKDFSRDSLNQK